MTENPLKKYLRENNVPLSELSSKTGIDRSILSRVSNGSASTLLSSVMRIKRATNGVVTADALGEALFPEDTKQSLPDSSSNSHASESVPA